MFKFKVSGEKLFEGVDVVIIRCPVCDGERLENPQGNEWVCCECGMEFETTYE